MLCTGHDVIQMWFPQLTDQHQRGQCTSPIVGITTPPLFKVGISLGMWFERQSMYYFARNCQSTAHGSCGMTPLPAGWNRLALPHTGPGDSWLYSDHFGYRDTVPYLLQELAMIDQTEVNPQFGG